MAADEEKLKKFIGRKGSPYYENRVKIAEQTRNSMKSHKSKALHSKMGKMVDLPHVSMGGKYRGGMKYVKDRYFGQKTVGEGKALYHEKQPTSFAKSFRRHQEK